MKREQQDVNEVDRWRREDASPWCGQSSHEWQHFIIWSRAGVLILNFSIEVPLAGPSKARLLVLHCDSTWKTDVRFSPDLSFGSSGLRCRMDGCILDIFAEGWRIELDDSGFVSGHMHFVPVARPLVARNRAIVDRARLHWVMYPLVRVHGELWLNGTRHVLDGDPVYHDHNWGRFDWGEDFGWEWGILMPDAAGAAIVFSALTCKTHMTRRLQQIFVWSKYRHFWTARGPEIRSSHHGALVPDQVETIPAVFALVSPPARHPPPLRLDFAAAGEGRKLEVQCELRRRARILVPTSAGPTSTMVLEECIGEAKGRISIEGRPVDVTGRCVFEFLGRDRSDC
ncbi:MAG: hypothetical protein H6730_06850 [Deltaproteobacteria bacterium]|nr:hypothetical protein [Deltaproteobacteria bacterium]